MKKGKRNKKRQTNNNKKKKRKKKENKSSACCQFKKENVSRPCRCMVKAIFRSRKSFKNVCCVYKYVYFIKMKDKEK